MVLIEEGHFNRESCEFVSGQAQRFYPHLKWKCLYISPMMIMCEEEGGRVV